MRWEQAFEAGDLDCTVISETDKHLPRVLRNDCIPVADHHSTIENKGYWGCCSSVDSFQTSTRINVPRYAWRPEKPIGAQSLKKGRHLFLLQYPSIYMPRQHNDYPRPQIKPSKISSSYFSFVKKLSTTALPWQLPLQDMPYVIFFSARHL